MSSDRDDAIEQLVTANRILAHEGILDAYGHVSIRDVGDPSFFLMSRARSPQLVEAKDILRFELNGTPDANSAATIPYIERFIHGAIYETRPDISAICHSHAPSTLPFSISTSVPLTAVIHTARFLGAATPVWDIADEFGIETDLLVRDVQMGRSLARTLGSHSVALMRGHGSVLVGTSAPAVVSMCIGMDQNAKVQLAAANLGSYKALNPGETTPKWYTLSNNGDNRAWEYYRVRSSYETPCPLS